MTILFVNEPVINCQNCGTLIGKYSEAYVSVVKEGIDPFVSYKFCGEKCSDKYMKHKA